MIELVKKINAVMQEMGAVEKNGKNTFQNYAYLAHADLMKALHPLLIKHGLVIYPKRVRVHDSMGETLENGEKTTRQNRVVCEVHYAITDGTDTMEFGGIGEGVDSQDKSAYKAQTGAHKYALKGLFCIPDELDAENEKFEKGTSAAENGQTETAHSTLKAGKGLAGMVLTYNQASILSDKEIDTALEKHKAKKLSDLPKDVAEALIELGKTREKALEA